VISDDEFDYLKKEFTKKFGKEPEILGTEKVLNKGFKKVQHDDPMGSLTEFNPDIDVSQEIQKWMKKYGIEDEFCTSEKLDGLSVNIKWFEGKLVQALTRGDGNEGDDITKNIKNSPNVPHLLPIPYSGSVRGEIVLLKSVCKKHFPQYANPRNGAVGLVKRLDGVGSEHLSVKFFKLNDNSSTFETEMQELDFIKNKLGLETPRYYKVSLKTLMALHRRYETEVREKLDYLLDGLVVSANCKKKQSEILENPLLPEYARKFKFESEKAETELLMVKNQVGRTGAITPLAILEPVICGGTKITKATLHNYDEIQRLGIKIGDFITVIRSKDVIPKITGVARKGEFEKDIRPPKNCPVCSSELKKEDTIIYCVNDYCGAKTTKSLLHWLNVLNIKNMGEKIVEGLIDKSSLKTIPDFYKLRIEDIANMDGQGTKNATKILREINSKKTLTISEILAGIGIRNLSVKRAEILEDQFGTLENIMELKTSDILKLDGFEIKLATYIVTGLKTKASLIEEILKHIKVKSKVGGTLAGKSFCFSGFRDPKLEDKIKAKGGRIASGVSKKLNYLVVRNKNGTTSKLEKSRKYGINIIEPDELVGLVDNTLF